jgi:hypothetical protein
MPALSVTLNGEHLVSVATDGFDVIDVSVSGDLLGPEHAILRVSGGSYPDGQKSQYLIWEGERVLVPGDSVGVVFLTSGATSRAGKSIEELYPGNKPGLKESFAPAEQMVRELKQRPKAFESLAFEFTGPDNATVRANTTPSEHGYAFTVLWNSHRPERARASAHTYTLDSLITKERGNYHAETKLAFGQGTTFKVLAPNSALLTDASTSPLRAQGGAAKRGR